MTSNLILNRSKVEIDPSMIMRIVDRLDLFSGSIHDEELDNDAKIKIVRENNELIAEIEKLTVQMMTGKF